MASKKAISLIKRLLIVMWKQDYLMEMPTK